MWKQNAARLEIISGWKDIANYLGKGVRTVQRYERELGLPIRRPAGKRVGSVIATKAELDGWITASPLGEAFRLPQTVAENAALLKEFRSRVEQLHLLRQENRALREELHASLKLLRSNLHASLARSDQSTESKPGTLAKVLTFDSAKTRVN
jgi:hypothetical protein